MNLKEQLHEYINRADERHLQAIYVLLEEEILSDFHYDKATLDTLYQRRENHLKGLSKSYSIEEAFESIRTHKNK